MTEESTVKKRVVKKRAPKDDLVEVITIRKIGLPDRTSEVGERVKITRESARALQEVGAIKVVI